MSCIEIAWRVFLAVLMACALAASADTRTVDRVIGARAVQGEILLDGILNEADWQGPAATGFTQREPVAGAASTERTEVRVAYTPATLYIGIRALDSDPGAVTAKEMRNDAELYQDDAVAVLLDTFLDHRNGYLFETNPNGARTEGLINDEGESVNMEWDGLWQVASRRTEDGWAAEMAIPFSTLRFAPGGGDWGLLVAHPPGGRHLALLPGRPADRPGRHRARSQPPRQAVRRGVRPRGPGRAQEPGAGR
jgi:hypothetical protein